MVKLKKKKEWFRASDFMQSDAGDYYIGDKANIIISELIKKYSYIFAIRMEGKFRAIKIEFHLLDIQMHLLEEGERAIINEELRLVEGRLL